MRIGTATKRSDAILLVYDLSRPETFQRLRRWLDLIARHREIPVVLVANKMDLNGIGFSGTDATQGAQIRQLMNLYRVSFSGLFGCFSVVLSTEWFLFVQFVVDSVACSSKNFAEVAKAFFLAQKAVLYPVEPLWNSIKKVCSRIQ